MRVIVTGTPGTGKTTATDLVDTDLNVVHLNDLIRDEGLAIGEDPERGSLVADIDALRERLADRQDVLVESHLAHHLDADRVVVLRCHPETLRERLLDRGEVESKAEENADAEALDVILSEAVDAHGLDSVYEIDTTDRTPEAVAADIEAVIAGERAPTAGEVEFLDYL
ncbi:adenylate kinase family protein [Natronomonas gomsonensis]|uniref:adenylate kinase family protein n=1 Tax=Natronomonas gomsonensis TaxID=1046043 RepID=UPI0015BA653F|nr:adenylate kinase family protein [Natronomonas gomsonensis]